MKHFHHHDVDPLHQEAFIDPRRWKWFSRGALFSMAGVVVALLALASFVDVTLSHNPDLCQGCHQIRPLYDEWKTSTHKDVACVDCHTQPGLAGLTEVHLNTVKNVATQVFGQEEVEIQADVSDASCLKCHPRNQLPEVIKQSAVRLDHTKHDQEKCTDCHQALVHTRQFESPLLVQNTVEHAESKCQVCHKPSSTFVHGPNDVACTSCHSATIPNHNLAAKNGVYPMSGCIECHNKQKVSSPEECQTCHVSPHGIEQPCGQCHSSVTTWTERSFTHPVKLIGNHAKLKCDQCHKNGKDFKGLTYACGNCHQAKHEERAGGLCAMCHTPLGFNVFGVPGDH